jgi:hypothetical protein
MTDEEILLRSRLLTADWKCLRDDRNRQWCPTNFSLSLDSNSLLTLEPRQTKKFVGHCGSINLEQIRRSGRGTLSPRELSEAPVGANRSSVVNVECQSTLKRGQGPFLTCEFT